METEYHRRIILCTKDTVAPGSGGSRREVIAAGCGVQRGCTVQLVIKDRC